MNKIGVGLYGWNGHQINEELGDLETAYLAGICDADDKRAQFKTLRDLLVSSEIELVSMCSPNRGEQAGDIILALEAGKHVIAEKPCALNERDLDAILELSVKKGLIFCEMDHSYFAQPYYKAMELVELGAIGDVAQVLCQKSYPYTDLRPQDESMDGGLILQSALYGFRWIQNIAGQEIKNIHTFATSFGNPKNGGLRMAASIQMELQNGGLAGIAANYFNNNGTGVWGYEELRIFGTKGILRTDIKEKCVYIYSDNGVNTYMDLDPVESQLSRVISAICTGGPLYMEPYKMTMPTRNAIRAVNNA